MKTRSYLALFAGILLTGAVFYSFSKEDSLLGSFGASSVLCSGTSMTTLYFDGAASDPRANGTRLKPYYDIADLEAALAADGTVERVCFTGTISSPLDLDAALSPSLTIDSYSSRATWNLGGTPGPAISLSSAAVGVTELSVGFMDFEDGLYLSPLDSLSVSNVIVDAGGDSPALYTEGTTLVTLSDSVFEDDDYLVHLVDVDEVNVSNSSFSEYYTGGLVADSVPQILVERSTFDGLVGPGLNGLYIVEDLLEPTTLTFRNNFVMNNEGYGIAVDYAARPSSLISYIYNNSFSENTYAFLRVGTMTVYNNIFVTQAARVSSTAYGHDTPELSLVSDHNMFWGRVATSARGLAEWQVEEALDSSSLYGDPLFVSSTSDLHLSAGSPAIDTGTVIPEVVDDIDGDDRGSFIDRIYDIGADEY